MLKASLLPNLPTPPEREPVAVGVRGREPPDAGSSREWERAQPDSEPVKTIGWQSCPAAMRVDSEVNVRSTKGREGRRRTKRAAGGAPGPEG